MSGSLPTASATRMFARVQDDRELLLLGVPPARTRDRPLIVPLPVAAGGAVAFPALDLPVDVFSQLDRCFAAGQAPVSLKRAAAPAAGVATAELELLAPDSSAAHEFRRRHPELADWALVSLRAPRGATAMFPVAIEFRSRDPQRLFFPTAALAGADLALYFEGFELLGYRGRVHDFARHPWVPADGSFRGEVATVYSTGLFPCLMTRLCLRDPPRDDTWVADALDGRPIVPCRTELGVERWRDGAEVSRTAITGRLSLLPSELRFMANPSTSREPIGPEGLEEARFYGDREDSPESFSIARRAIAGVTFDEARRELSVTTVDGRHHLFDLAGPLALAQRIWIADTLS